MILYILFPLENVCSNLFVLHLLAFAKAAEAISSRQKIKVQKWWKRKKKKPKN